MITLSQLTPHLARGWQTRTNSAGSVALTFDDGPDPETTPLLLKMLDDAGLKATMFVVGQKCRKQGSLLREVYAAGHSIACHGYVHTRHGFRGKAFLERSIRQSSFLLDEFGVKI
ncbi:MAG: polysaccharide deacetylase family protein [bacterium]|nr:polysaccharide deacetylase family protein [bacterium]